MVRDGLTPEEERAWHDEPDAADQQLDRELRRARQRTASRPDPYVCAACGTRYVVPSLALDCLERCTRPLSPACATVADSPQTKEGCP